MISFPSRRALLAAALGPVLSLTALAVPAAASERSAFDAVNQFIGTEMDTTQNKSNDAYGNTFPGAAVPFGMVQPSPTTYKAGNALVGEKGGYEYTASLIRGFGMTRYSGTGCTGRFGGYEFPTIPYAGDVLPVNPSTDIKGYYLGFSHDNEVSQPGYYKVALDNGVTTELTATARTSVSRFTFPSTSAGTLILDVSGQNNRSFGSEITIDPATRTVSGWMFGADVCDVGNTYKAYFSTTYDKPFASYGTWNDADLTAGSAHAIKAGTDTSVDYRHDTGGWVTFKPGAKVTAKTGFSYVSVSNAAENREHEVHKKDFSEVRREARDAWQDALGTVDAKGGDAAQRTSFYTALYHAFLQPNVREDVNRQYLGFDGQTHTVDRGHHFYRNINFAGSGWDMYRSQAQLLALTFPKVANDINRSIVAMVQQTGKWAPGAARMQGDNYQVILSTLDDMGATDYDREAALASMVSTQKLPAVTTTRSDAYQYFSTGLIENRKGDFATSRVLEYSVDDFAIAQLAARLGDTASADFFSARSQNWMNVFDPVTQHIRPRERTGFDRSFDLRVREDGAGRGQFNQSTGYQYGWMVPHNLSTLITKRGGVATATAQLDTLMAQLDAGAYTQTGNYLSNQAAFNTPWVYNWLSAPARTSDTLRRAVSEMYDTSPSGLPGNDDQGSLSSWYVFAQLGFYPAIYGTGDLVISGPMFSSVTIDPIGGGHRIKIKTRGAGRYVTGLKVNGKRQTASWVDASFARRGGTLAFTMSDVPGTWGTGAADVPPSYTAGADARNNAGTTPDGQGNLGSMDLSDWSLSRNALAAAGATPGAALTVPGLSTTTFTWPSAAPGAPDNWIPHGQRIAVGKAGTSVSFLGLATNGPATGTATVQYTDGTSQQVTVMFGDWAAAAPAGNAEALTLAGRNNVNGTAGTGTFRVFATTPATLDPARTVAAVTLPEYTDKGIMHIFDVAVS